MSEPISIKMSGSIRNNSKTTPIKTTPSKMTKKNSYRNLTSEKYLNAKLDFSERKKVTMQKTVQIKNERIKELEEQVRENQKLVSETLKKWKDYQNEVERKGRKEITQMQGQIFELNVKFDQMEGVLMKKQEENRKIAEENESIRQQREEMQAKYDKLERKYRQDKREWSETCILMNPVIELLQKIPSEVFEAYGLALP